MNFSIWLRLAALTALICVASPALAQTTRTWTGAVDNRWSVAGNWNPAGSPVDGDSLVFPNSAAISSVQNDLAPGTSIAQVTVSNFGYTLSGNSIELSGAWTGFGTAEVGFPINVAANAVTFSSWSTFLVGELSGTGPVLVSGNLELSGAHSYSGNMTVQNELNLDGADLSQAALEVQGYLAGDGSVGPLDWTGGGIVLGVKRIETGDLVASGWGTLSFDIQEAVPGVGQGQLRVAGGVDLGTSKSLDVSFYSTFVPIMGQELVLIDNDDSDPIGGAFVNRPEGSIILHNGAELQVSYVGGDGNDLSLTCISAPRVWNGAVSWLWSEPGNWTPMGVPVSGDYLRFPSEAANLSSINDLPAGTEFSSIEFASGGFSLSGNGIVLTEWLGGGWQSNQVSLPIAVEGNAVEFSGSLRQSGELSGTGPILVSGSLDLWGVHTYSGSMTVEQTLQMDDADLTQATIVLEGNLTGEGAVGPVDWSDGGRINPGIGRIDTGNLAASGWGDLSVLIDGSIPGVDQGQLRVAGSVDLGTAKHFNPNITSNFVPFAGQELVLIANDGNDPISGAFANLLQGSIITHNGAELQVSYSGGDGNDFSLTCISAPRVWSGEINGLWSEPGNWVHSVAPVAGDYLRFPSEATTRSTFNDLPSGTSFRRVEVDGYGYTLSGNRVELTERLDGSWTTRVTMSIDVAANAVTLAGNAHIVGELTGSGPLLVPQSPTISGAHGYSGTLTVQGGLTLDDANLSQVTLVLQGSLYGNGLVGPVDWSGWSIDPELGRLETGELTATGSGSLFIQIDGTVPAVSHGQLRVNGIVDLGTGKSLSVNFDYYFTPIEGQTWVLIDNDGNDPINGEFSNLPEGSIIVHNGAELLLSYVGGDGNDLSLTCISAPRVWNGTLSGLWSDPGNWTPSGVPQTGDYLRFPHNAPYRITTNDLPHGTAFSRIEVVGSGYSLNGNGIQLTEWLMSGSWNNRINLPVDVAENAVTFLGYPHLAGELSGSGPVLVSSALTFSGTHSYDGTMTVESQLALDNADLSQATLIVDGSLQGNGTVGPVDWSGSGIHLDQGRIETSDLTASGPGTLSFQIAGTIPAVSHGQLRVAGAIDLGTSKYLSLNNGWNLVPGLGQELVLIDNDESEAITGTFNGLPEGSTTFAGGFSYQVSYMGGDGNDLSITSLNGRLPTTTNLASSSNPSQTGQWVTLTATVSSGAQTPSGQVIFREGSTILGTGIMDVGGVAILSTASLEPGSRSITAEYLGGPAHGGSASAPLIQIVGDFHALTYTAGPNGSLFGESPQQVIEGGDGSEVTAVPDVGYRFEQWSDASLANPRIDADVTENLSVEAQFGIDPDVGDLEVAKDNGLQAALDGQVVVYSITVANAGLVAANGAQLSDVLPTELVDGEWACVPVESNTACPAPPFNAGTGDLYAEIDLPVGGYLRYDLSARIQAGSGATVSNTASVVPPAGLDDLDPSNNSATDSTLIEPEGIFGTGFEAGPVVLTVPAAVKAQREASGGSQ